MDSPAKESPATVGSGPAVAPALGVASDGLSSFKYGLFDALEVRLRELFGLPGAASVEVEAVHDAAEDARAVQLVIDVGGLPRLRFVVAAVSEARAWARGQALSLSYRNLEDGRSPHDVPELAGLLGAVKRRFLALEADRGPGLLEEMGAVLPHLRTGDWMYRAIARTESGVGEATLRLGFRCNQDCSFCWQGRSWPEPPPGWYERWLDEFQAQGVRSLVITGGEPTLNRALPELLRRATQDHGMSVMLQTNAIQLAKERVLGKLVESGLRELFVSFHSADAGVSDRLTRAPGTHQRTVAGIHAALAAGLRVTLNAVVEADNLAGIVDHARFIATEFVAGHPENPVVSVQYSHPCAYYEEQDWERAVVPLDVVRDPIVEATEILTGAGVEVRVSGSCGFPACVFQGHELAGQLLADAALAEQDVSGRAYGEVCRDCAVRAQCIGLRQEYMRIHGERGARPFDSAPGPVVHSGLVDE
jgi:pyruvate-formate lyase-activating enzyme